MVHLIFMSIIMFIFRCESIATYVWTAGFIVFAMWLGTNSLVKKIRIKTDLSYGIFLYGWPVGQIVKEILPDLLPEFAILINIVIATILAAISWKIRKLINEIFVEKEEKNEPFSI